MAIAPIERFARVTTSADMACAALAEFARDVSRPDHVLSRDEALQFIVDIERASRIVDHLQILAARLADEHRAVADEGRSRTSPADSSNRSRAGNGDRDCAEFLRATLGISRAEARRRLGLAEVLLPRMSATGAALPPRLEVLGATTDRCLISSRAASIVSQALERVQAFATPRQLESMEHHLTRQAVESDEDVLRVLARRWEGVLDQDGQEPSERVLRARQGVFLKGRRNGLHFLEIGATDEQFEHLVTVMNTTAHPRTYSEDSGDSDAADTVANRGTRDAKAAINSAAPRGSVTGASLSVDLHGATRSQALLDGLVTACRIALTTASLPATGGHRPQVMVTIDYKDLTGQLQRAGHAVFSQQISAANIRKLACDADIIPFVLGSSGQVLDVGRAQRLFPPHQRRALVARDKGCAFPDCSIPATWCEAHHMKPWSRGGTTSIDNGVLLCSRHHHLIHQGTWTVEPRRGVPWFSTLLSPGRRGKARRNTYWQAGQSVHEELLADRARSGPDTADPADSADSADPADPADPASSVGSS